MIKAIQEQQRQIEELKTQVASLLTSKNTSTSADLSSAYLGQNTPNPVRGVTTIRYYVPDGTVAAQLVLSNSKGQVLRTVSLTARGASQLNLNTQALSAGAYTYSLLVDGRMADSKQLVIAR